MDWDNHRQERQYFEKPPESTTWKYFKVGLGLMLGITVAWLIYAVIVGSWVMGAANEMQKQNINTMNAHVERIRIQSEQIRLNAERQVAENRRIEQLKLQYEAQERAERNRQQLQAAEMEMQERQAKEAEWERFYKKRVECDNPASNAALVECGNEYMRAQRKFELQWEAKRQQGLGM